MKQHWHEIERHGNIVLMNYAPNGYAVFIIQPNGEWKSPVNGKLEPVIEAYRRLINDHDPFK